MIANEVEIWKALHNAGFNDIASAGILANMYSESHLKPDNVQNTYESKVGTDEAYTRKINERTYTREQFANDHAGYGLCQWTYPTRKQALYDFCMVRSGNIASITDQVLFLAQECRSSGLFDKLNRCATPYDAGVMFMLQFEKPKNQTVTAQKMRGELAIRFYNDNVSTVNLAQRDYNLDRLYEIVQDTLAGKYGNGEVRAVALGDDYEIVQKIINHISK